MHATGYSALAGITSLTRLSMHDCAAIPVSLSQLTSLESCCLLSTPDYELQEDALYDGDHEFTTIS